MVAVLIILPAVVVGVYLYFRGETYTFVLERQTIQNAVSKKVPLEKRFALIFKLTVHQADVLLTEGSDRIGIDAAAVLNIGLGKEPKSLDGSINADTSLSYNQDTFCFYLHNPVVHGLTIQGIPQRYTDRVSKASQSMLHKHLPTIRVYRISDKNLKMKLARAVLKDVRVKDGKLHVTLGF